MEEKSAVLLFIVVSEEHRNEREKQSTSAAPSPPPPPSRPQPTHLYCCYSRLLQAAAISVSENRIVVKNKTCGESENK